MNLDILFSGFGGQGILFISKILSYASLDSGFNVTWLPSYGPEMRGGTANCSVVISDKKISSPVVSKPKYMIAMNQPSFDKYKDKVVDGGVILFNSDIIKNNFSKDSVKCIDIPIQTMARSISDKVFGNIVMLGSLVKLINIVSMDSIINSLKVNSNKKFDLEGNKQALKLGYDFL